MATFLTRVDPTKNMARWHEIDVQPTLFGDYVVQRHWGRIGTAGQSKNFWFRDENAADEMAKSVVVAKARRGYKARPLPVEATILTSG